MKVIQNNWLTNFLKELGNTKELKIISPFITDNMVTHLLNNWEGNTIEVITRFNLNDFRSGASNLNGLKRLIENGAEIKGIKDLHSKAYIFDKKSMIITSANFTNGGFFNNHELGIRSESEEQIKETLNYFKKLWTINDELLDASTIIEWQNIIAKNRTASTGNNLPDYGNSFVKKVIGEKNYFIKFYGTNDERAGWNEKVIDEIAGTHCHFAVTFSDSNGRPRRYQEGDVIYIARMLEGGEYAIYGRAIARSHIDSRDVASKDDMAKINWKKYYPVYIRVHSAEFINSTLGKCPMMGKLISDLGYDCFRSTKQRHINGEININPRNTLMQKADVILSEDGAYWVEQQFQKAKKKLSQVPQAFIDGLYQGNPKI